MIHLIILFVCILSVEILTRLNFLSLLELILKVTRKVTHIILADTISDHWKARVIPAYSFKIMKYSLQILFILLLILSLFLIAEYFVSDFMKFAFSSIGIIEATVFGFGYIFLRNFFIE